MMITLITLSIPDIMMAPYPASKMISKSLVVNLLLLT